MICVTFTLLHMAIMLSHVHYLLIPWIVAYQALLSIGFSRQEH